MDDQKVIKILQNDLGFSNKTIDKIREFDPVSQRSLDSINKITLTPTGFNGLISDKIRENI